MTELSPKESATFFAKTWYLYVGALLFTALAAFSTIMGPLFLLEAIKPTHGRSGTEAGIALSFVSRTSARCARGVAVTGQIVGIIANLPFVVLALMVGLIGLTHGTDTSVRENNILAISGLSFAAIGTITCFALLVSQRPFFRVLFVTAGVANGAMLVVALYHATIGASEPGNIQSASIFYGLEPCAPVVMGR